MDVPAVERLRLTEREESLFKRVDRDLIDDPPSDPQAMFDASVELTGLLQERQAIPNVRLRYFVDPEYNIGGHGRSRQEVFERNGAHGEDILRSPHFVAYLRYFVLGPDLPRPTIDAFRQVLIADAGTSGMLLDQLRKFTRAEVRGLTNQRDYRLPEEFFKLALECGLDMHFASTVRNAAATAK